MSTKSNNLNEKVNVIYFYSHSEDEEWGVFSQFYQPCVFTDENGVEYNCAEQWMMASKARLFGDELTLKKILGSRDPFKIKALGREVNSFDNDKWDGVKYEIVVEGNRLKFGQNPKLGSMLKATGDAVLVEAAPKDHIWGIGISVKDAKNGRPWNGQNLLGKALMAVRDSVSKPFVRNHEEDDEDEIAYGLLWEGEKN